MPNLLSHQRFIGIGKPDSLLPQKTSTILPVSLAHPDPLSVFDTRTNNTEAEVTENNDAFQVLMDKGLEIDEKSRQEAGKQGLSRQDYQQRFWQEYLDQSQDQALFWKARASIRYRIMNEIYHDFIHTPGELFTLTRQAVELFQRVNIHLAGITIYEIADEVNKRKKQKNKIPPMELLAEVLAEKKLDTKSFPLLLNFAKKSPTFKKSNPAMAGLQKLL